MNTAFIPEIGRWLGGPMLKLWNENAAVRKRWVANPPPCMGESGDGSAAAVRYDAGEIIPARFDQDLAFGQDSAILKPGERLIPFETFVTLEQLAADTKALAAKVAGDVDAVVQVSRSGNPVGSAVAMLRHLPVYSFADNTGVTFAGTGWRMRENDPRRTPRHVLVVDDTAHSGRQMDRATLAAIDAFPGARITRAVVYMHPRARWAVDLCVGVLGGWHYLEWNFVNAGHGERMAVDFDGILCEDCPIADDDDGPRYLRFLDEAVPKYLPVRVPVPMIVTARHEKYRRPTEEWLSRYGVRAERLVMRDFEHATGPARLAKIAQFKARHYLDGGAKLFVESETVQARLIAELTGRPVLCPEAGRLFAGQSAADPQRHGRRCLQLLGRQEHKEGCGGWKMRHGCEYGLPAVPADLCSRCPQFVDDGKF